MYRTSPVTGSYYWLTTIVYTVAGPHQSCDAATDYGIMHSAAVGTTTTMSQHMQCCLFVCFQDQTANGGFPFGPSITHAFSPFPQAPFGATTAAVNASPFGTVPPLPGPGAFGTTSNALSGSSTSSAGALRQVNDTNVHQSGVTTRPAESPAPISVLHCGKGDNLCVMWT